MPLYEYWCQACGYEREELVLGEEPLLSCPVCGARLTKKVGKIAHFEFKGVLA